MPSADSVTVRVLDAARGHPGRRAWPDGEVSHDDGSAEILIDCEGLEWVTGWVLGFGRHAGVVAPERRAAPCATARPPSRQLDPTAN